MHMENIADPDTYVLYLDSRELAVEEYWYWHRKGYKVRRHNRVVIVQGK